MHTDKAHTRTQTKESNDPLRVSMLRNLSVSILVMLLIGFAPEVDFASHLGGLVVGTLIGLYYWGAHGITPLNNVPILQFVRTTT